MPRRRPPKLYFGPYKTPRFKYGQVVMDESRGEVRIVGLSSGRIPWPIGERGYTKRKTLILYKGLVRAVRNESVSALTYWWGISRRLAWRWRKALGVKVDNPGTKRLRQSYGHAPWMELARRNSHSRAGTVERRAKIAAAKIGQPRPPHVLEAMLKGRRRKMLSARRRRKINKVPRKHVARSWAAWEDALLRLSARDIIAQTGRSLSSIRSRRRELYLLQKLQR